MNKWLDIEGQTRVKYHKTDFLYYDPIPLFLLAGISHEWSRDQTS